MVAVQESHSHSIFVQESNPFTPWPSPMASSCSSEAHQGICPGLQVHVTCHDDGGPSRTRFSSPCSSPLMEIELDFATGPSHPESILSCQHSPSVLVESNELNGSARLLPADANETEFVEEDGSGRLEWKEAEELQEFPDCSKWIGAMEEPDGAMGDRSPRLHFSTESSLLPQIKFAMETNGRNLHGKITMEDIEKAIMSSASMNKITLSREEAEECAQLIVEELDAGHGGANELHKLEGMDSSKAPFLHVGWSMSWASLLFRTQWRRGWVVVLWLAACAALFAWKFVQYRHRLAFEVMGYCLCTAKGAAETLKLNMALVLLPVCRNTVTWLRSVRRINSVVPFNDNINFHKLVAAGIVVGIILHGGTHLTCDFPRIANADRSIFRQTIAYCFQYHQPSYLQILLSTEGATGIAMVLLMLAAFLLATRPSRRRPASLPGPISRWAGFNAFWYSHHLLILVYVLLVVHSMFLFLTDDVTEKTTWMYIAIPVLIYAGERLYRTVRSATHDVKILRATVYPGKVLSLKLMKPAGFTFRSGMHIYVQCPEVSRFEWHPFSLTSSPADDHLGLHIRSLGDWSCEVYSIFQEALVSSKPSLPRISIDGPYGAASQDYVKYKIILLIGLGIGATPFISILKDIANDLQKLPQENVGNLKGGIVSHPEKAYFYWVTREQGSFEWFRDIMKEVSALNKGVIEMHNYLTSVFREGDKRSALVRAVQALQFMKSGVDIISKTPVRTKFARPNWPRVFSRLAHRHGGKKIGVFYCGPGSLGSDLQRLCHEMTIKTSTRFVFHKEHF